MVSRIELPYPEKGTLLAGQISSLVIKSGIYITEAATSLHNDVITNGTIAQCWSPCLREIAGSALLWLQYPKVRAYKNIAQIRTEGLPPACRSVLFEIELKYIFVARKLM